MKYIKKIKNINLIFIIIISSIFILSSCSNSNSNNSPEDIIKDVYGDTKYKISFYQENLDTPIDDIYYSANNMPKLPQPQKLGYIFEGWYYDIDYTIPYEDNSLYLHMENVLLYAKFSEEEFVTNGIYDIEFDCEIVEDTLEKGELADVYGFKDLTKDLMKDEILIEKNDNGKFLKLVFDSKVTTSMTQSPVYEVAISPSISLKCNISNVIFASNDPIKTIFIDITKLNISDDILLSVTSTFYENTSLSQSEIAKTTSTYTVKFNITKLLGFRTGFENTENDLENGNYLVKTYYRTISNESSMMDSFNSVYAYLNVKNGDYKLIKEFYPYSGMVGVSSINNYYSRLMSFASINLFYRLEGFDYTNINKITSTNYLKTYDATYYQEFTTEFDANTGKYYYIYDLGNDYKSAIYQEMSVSGYMEVASSMGSIGAIMYIDLASITKTSNIRYEEINEDNGYTFTYDFDYYPNDLSSDSNLEYDSDINYGISNYFINTFYNAASASSASGRVYYSFKSVVTPNYLGDIKDINNPTSFTRTITIYGYDGLKDLFVDTMTVQKYNGSGLRKSFEIKNGKTFNLGDSIDIEELFKEKVSKYINFSDVTYIIYNYNGNKIDYDNPYYELYEFKNKCIIFFEFENGFSTLILDLYEEPDIEVIDYDTDYVYIEGEIAKIPSINYTWKGFSYTFIDNFYLSGDGDKGIDPMWSFYYTDGDYKNPNYFMRETLKIKLESEITTIVYEIRNIYNERIYKEIELKCYGSQSYKLYDKDNVIIESGSLKLNDNDELKRQAISSGIAYDYLIYDINEIDKIKELSFYLELNAKSYHLYNELILTSVTYNSKNEYNTYYVGDYSSIDEFINDIKNKSINDGYSKMIFHFKNYSNAYEGKEDSYYIKYVYNLLFNGKKGFNMNELDTYFIGKEYYYIVPYISSYNTDNYLLKGSFDIRDVYGKLGGATSNRLGYQTTFMFNNAGNYYITYSLTINSNDGLFYQTASIYIKSDIEVYDGEIEITYITDSLHPFKDNSLEMTVSYNPYEEIMPLDASYYDVTSKSHLYSYYLFPDYDPSKSGIRIEPLNYVDSFSTKHIYLYAYFDDGITVTVNYSEMNGTIYSPIKLTYYRNQAYNSYRIDLSEIKIITPPSGYVYIGITGGFLGDKIIIPEKNEAYNIYSSDDISLFVVYKKECIIEYSNRQEISSHIGMWKSNDKVIEGNKLTPIETIDGAIFIGYYIYGDETKTLLDLDTYIVTSNLKLVAVFE